MRKIQILITAGLFTMLMATPAHAAIIDDSWSMVPDGSDVIAEISGSDRDGTVLGAGTWHTVGSAGIEYDTDEVYVEVANSADDNPETREFAIGAKVTSDDVSGFASGYSGNVIQKGNFGDAGQIKLQIIKDDGGTFECRFKGATTNYFIQNDEEVDIDDGDSHWAMCWLDEGVYGITVDGNADADTSTTSVGSIENTRNIRMGNKSPSGDELDQHFGRNTCSAYSHGNNSKAHVAATLSAGC